jgi:hypothetical protein
MANGEHKRKMTHGIQNCYLMPLFFRKQKVELVQYHFEFVKDQSKP